MNMNVHWKLNKEMNLVYKWEKSMNYVLHYANSIPKKYTLSFVLRRHEELDRCVLCWHLTGVPRNTSISERKCYIQGQGQLCERCYFELYKRGVFDGQENA